VISQPSPLTAVGYSTAFKQGAGALNYVLNTASTNDDINCPVTSYQVTPSILSSITQVNQPSCGSPENS
jgi:hypothetical protein